MMNDILGVALVIGFSLVPVVASAQLSSCPVNSNPANADYSLNSGGIFCLVGNTPVRQSGGTTVKMADPTVVKIDGNYYLSGTTDDLETGNYAIYRSPNLVNWTYHGVAFSGTRVGSQITINGRKFCNLWGPHLYMDPADPSNVWLVFTATEDRGPAYNFCTPPPPGTPALTAESYQSVFVTSANKTAFVSGGGFSFADAAMGRGHEPVWYGYRVQNNPSSALLFDGGYQQSLVPPQSFRTIPVTGSAELMGSGSTCGMPLDSVYRLGARFGHKCQGTNTWIALDASVFFDPTAGNRRWFLYTWSVDELYPPTDFGAWDGNHVAAYPLLNNGQMDALATADHIPIANRLNRTEAHKVNDVWNGQIAYYDDPPNNEMMGDERGVAEGPAAFRWNGYTYVTYSRNAWTGPGYGIFYRKVSGSLRSAALSSWGDELTGEMALLTAFNRSKVRGPSFGSGEVFIGPGSKPYLVFHAKANGSTTRTVYFKELYFDANSNIKTIKNGTTPLDQNTAAFLIPR